MSWWRYRSASRFFDFQLSERLVDVNKYWLGFGISYLILVEAPPEKKGTQGGICSEIWRDVGLKVMKVMLTWIFFWAAECSAKPGRIHVRGRKASWLFFLCLAGSRGKLWFLLYHSQLAGVVGPPTELTCASLLLHLSKRWLQTDGATPATSDRWYSSIIYRIDRAGKYGTMWDA